MLLDEIENFSINVARAVYYSGIIPPGIMTPPGEVRDLSQ